MSVDVICYQGSVRNMCTPSMTSMCSAVIGQI